MVAGEAVRVFMALRVSHEAREDARTFFSIHRAAVDPLDLRGGELARLRDLDELGELLIERSGTGGLHCRGDLTEGDIVTGSLRAGCSSNEGIRRELLRVSGRVRILKSDLQVADRRVSEAATRGDVEDDREVSGFVGLHGSPVMAGKLAGHKRNKYDPKVVLTW